MFEVIVGNSLSKRVKTQAEIDNLVLACQSLFGKTVNIKVNEIKPLFDEKGKEISSMTVRIKELPDTQP